MYDEAGLVDDAVFMTLGRMKEVVSRIIVICNGLLESSAKMQLNEIADEIIERSNSGYDVEAYKEYFCNHDQEEWTQWDELIIMNNSIYGPLFSLKEWMQADLECNSCDMWGLKGYLCKTDMNQTLGIPPFFLVIKKKITANKAFRDYWEKLQFSNYSYDEALELMERGLPKYLQEKGFTVRTRIPVYQTQTAYFISNHEVILEDIKERTNPFVKRRLFSIYNWKNCQDALRIIGQQNAKDATAIEKNIKRISHFRNWAPGAIDGFILNHKQFFIYGEGTIAQGVKEYLTSNNLAFGGFITTLGSDTSVKCSCFARPDDAGIIVAIGRSKISIDQINEIVNKYGKKHVFYLF